MRGSPIHRIIPPQHFPPGVAVCSLTTIQFLPRFGHVEKWSIECFHMTSRRPYWCSKTMKRRPCWCPKPILWELNSSLMQTLSFVPINMHRCRHVSENTLLRVLWGHCMYFGQIHLNSKFLRRDFFLLSEFNPCRSYFSRRKWSKFFFQAHIYLSRI